MMGRQDGRSEPGWFYTLQPEKRIPERYLLRRINPIVDRILANFRETLAPFYREIGRPSIGPRADDPACSL